MENLSDDGAPAAPGILIRSSEKNTDLVCLNFKVPLHVRKHLKLFATANNMTMTEVLLQLLADRIKLPLQTEMAVGKEHNK
jgi:hypothetical protein